MTIRMTRLELLSGSETLETAARDVRLLHIVRKVRYRTVKIGQIEHAVIVVQQLLGVEVRKILVTEHVCNRTRYHTLSVTSRADKETDILDAKLVTVNQKTAAEHLKRIAHVVIRYNLHYLGIPQRTRSVTIVVDVYHHIGTGFPAERQQYTLLDVKHTVLEHDITSVRDKTPLPLVLHAGDALLGNELVAHLAVHLADTHP